MRKNLGTVLLAAVLIVLLAGTGVLIWRSLPEGETEAEPTGQPEIPADTTATLCVAGDLVLHMPLVSEAWNGEAYDFTYLFADAQPYYKRADYTTAGNHVQRAAVHGIPAVLRTGCAGGGSALGRFPHGVHGKQSQSGYLV